MTLSHERTLETMFYESIREEPQLAATAAEVRTRLLEGGFYASDFVDASFQKWEREHDVVTLIDAFGFALMWTYYQRGDIAYCSVPLPSGPGPDRGIEFNQSVLNQLPRGFRATYSPERGPAADDDGSFTIGKDIGLWRTFRTGPDEQRDRRDEQWYFDSDRTIALEVGTTSVSKTLYHLRQGKGVARWPYGRDKIIVLAGVKTNIFDKAVTEYVRKKAAEEGALP